MEIEENERLVQILKGAIKEELGRCFLEGVPYGTDASRFVSAGMKAVVFGPGHPKHAHASVEYVEIRQVIRAAKILVRAITGFNENRPLSLSGKRN